MKDDPEFLSEIDALSVELGGEIRKREQQQHIKTRCVR